MSFKQGKTCPVCQKEHLFYLSDHLRQVHQLSSEERQSWLKSAVFSPSRTNGLPPYPFWGMPQYPSSTGQQLPLDVPRSMKPKQPKTTRVQAVNCLETQAYPEFMFQHMFSMLVVGPSQCGKTYFVQQLLTRHCIEYPYEKPIMVYWFYNQWQPRYDDIKRTLKKRIRFAQGLPENPEFNNILVFDDLMSQASDSPVLSQLFTQGRHRNASVILLLQNMFPKGKYNTDISRNALYKVLFRSPRDRKQIDIMAEQTFAKDRKNFVSAYVKETEKPFGYIILDNHPRTASENQVVADVFGSCYTYPHITKRSALSPGNGTPEVLEQPQTQSKPSDQRTIEVRSAKKPKHRAVKRKVDPNEPPAKKQKHKVHNKRKKKPVKMPRKVRKEAVYPPTFIRERCDEQLHSDGIDVDSEGEIRHCTLDELNKVAKQAYRNGHKQQGFGPKIVYE